MERHMRLRRGPVGDGSRSSVGRVRRALPLSGGRHASMRSFALVLALALVLTGLCAGTASAERLKVRVSINCGSATYTYAGFPNANNNTVTDAVRVDGTLVTRQQFSFNGP